MTTPSKPISQFSGKYRWLSNFFSCQVVSNYYIVYPSVENAYQASKLPDQDDRLRIYFTTITSAEAKHLGKVIDVRPNWESIKLQVMEDLLRQKFSDKAFRELLLETGDRDIIEGNTWGDTYWGQCNGEGENNLGKLIMKIREEL